MARQRIEEAPFRGDFEDDAAPGFLVNPWTAERMELDRFYPPSVAFEFNGPQHYGPTERFTQEDADRQRGRDYMKLGICASRGGEPPLPFLGQGVLFGADSYLTGISQPSTLRPN